MAEWKTPKTDWVTNPKNPVAEDFNRIEGNIDFLKQDIETKKGAIVNALNTVGLETQLTDTHAQIANKIVAANQGTKIYTPSTVNQPIPKGFHSGQGYVKGDANLKPENIAVDKTIFGITGTYLGKFIKSIQQGCFTFQTGDTAQTITINYVNLDSSVLLVSVPSCESTISYISLQNVALSDARTISVQVSARETSKNCNIQWTVIEFEPSIVKSKQTGSFSFYKSSDLQDVTITPVAISKSIIINHGFIAYTSGSLNNINRINMGAMPAYFVNSSTIRFQLAPGTHSFSSITLTWQVIEFV